jgi:5S rRNA maturation endonuclease (ribonuclease M5)
MIKKDELMKEIEKAKNNNLLIIVEGKKDKIALEKLGLHNIFVLNENGKSIFVKIEEIAMKKEECVVLTDFDKKGRKIYSIIKNELLQRGVKMNSKLRVLLLKAHLSHIEGISTFFTNVFNNFYPR